MWTGTLHAVLVLVCGVLWLAPSFVASHGRRKAHPPGLVRPPAGFIPIIQTKALFCSPVGKKAKDRLPIILKTFGNTAFDFLFFAYDATNWEQERWYRDPHISVVKEEGMGKWVFAEKYLQPGIVKNYSHIFFWDDDVAPSTRFDALQYLFIIQRNGIHMSQPMVSKGGHCGRKGTCIGEDELFPFTRKIPTVEVMAPVYSVEVWRTCFHNQISVSIDPRGTGWGVDVYLGNCGACFTVEKKAINLPVWHMDTQSINRSTFSQSGTEAAMGYQKLTAGLKCSRMDG
jgi:hypothetical protein